MKAIMISIKPKWAAKILNGEKTIEIRKTMPKCDLPIDVYIYCTKEDSLSLLKTYPKDTYVCEQEFKCNDFPYLCSGYEGKGKVVAKFTLNKVEEITPQMWTPKIEHEILEKSCLKKNELFDYVCSHEGTEDKPFYAWHISNLEIFNKPKELREFRYYKRFDCYNADFDYRTIEYRKISLTKAPQNYMFIEVE